MRENDVRRRLDEVIGRPAPQPERGSEGQRQALMEEIKDELHKQLECWRVADGELAEDGVLDNIIAIFGARYDAIAHFAEPKATPKEPAAPNTAALLSREELEGLAQQKRELQTLVRSEENAILTWGEFDRLVATALAGIEAREDAERLDWLEANCEVQTHRPLLQWPNMNGNTLREDIDSARTAEKRQ